MTPYRQTITLDAIPRRPTREETMKKFNRGMINGPPWRRWDALAAANQGLLVVLLCLMGPHPYGGWIDIPCGILGLVFSIFAAFRYWREAPYRRLVEEAEAELKMLTENEHG
jgi:hypothetical protein